MAVYFVQAGKGGAIKIGTGQNAAARLSTLQTGNAEELTLIAVVEGGRELEQQLHERFASLKIRGEWFSPDDYLLAFIDGLTFNVNRSQEAAGPDAAPDLSGLTPDQLEVCCGFTMGMADGVVFREVRRNINMAGLERIQRLLCDRPYAPYDCPWTDGYRAAMDRYDVVALWETCRSELIERREKARADPETDTEHEVH